MRNAEILGSCLCMCIKESTKDLYVYITCLLHMLRIWKGIFTLCSPDFLYINTLLNFELKGQVSDNGSLFSQYEFSTSGLLTVFA